MVHGDELLVVDAHPPHREGMRTVFSEDGFVVTAVAETVSARRLLASKFFPVAVIDADTEPDSLVDLVHFAIEKSPRTSILILSSRRSFDTALSMFRLGVFDVIYKAPAEVEYLRQRAATAAGRVRWTEGQGLEDLVRDVDIVVEEALQQMMALTRQLPESQALLAPDTGKAQVLLVDDDLSLVEQIGELATEDVNYVVVGTAGAGLDVATSRPLDVIAARGTLSDLPGAMMVRTLQTDKPDVAALVYDGPKEGGTIDVFIHGRAHETLPFSSARDLNDALIRQIELARATRRERRFLQAFRAQHQDFLRRYVELKVRVDQLKDPRFSATGGAD